jgi:hypothetical protein
MQLASTTVGSPCPLSSESPSATQRQRGQAASPRYTRPKPEIILHDEIMPGTRANRFSPRFDAVALAAPVAGVVRRAVEEEQYRMMRDQCGARENSQDRELFDGHSRCAPPWAAEYATPTSGSARRPEQVQDPGHGGAASVAQVPSAPLGTTHDPAGICELPPPLHVEQKPVRNDDGTFSGTGPEPEMPSFLKVPRAHSGPAEEADPALSKHKMVTRNSSAQFPLSLAAAYPVVSPAVNFAEIVQPREHPAHALPSPRRAQPATLTGDSCLDRFRDSSGPFRADHHC